MLRHRPSGVAVLSPTESSGYSGSDITEPRSPRSPESSCSTGEDSAGARMPPWASDPASPAPRRLAAQPAPVRRSQPIHRRITEFFNHKMKPPNGLKRDLSAAPNDDNKKKCLPKNGATQDLEKYISYLSKTLNPKVLMEVEKQPENIARKPPTSTPNGAIDSSKPVEHINKLNTCTTINGVIDISKPKDSKEKLNKTYTGFMKIRNGNDTFTKEKTLGLVAHGRIDNKNIDIKITTDPSANGINKLVSNNCSPSKRKVPIEKMPASCSDLVGLRIAPGYAIKHSLKMSLPKLDCTRNGVVSSTTKIDSKINSVTCGSNNLSLNPITPKVTPTKKEVLKKTPQAARRTNRKSSACIANSKNLTWSKVNNLKQQVQQQKHNCVNSTQNTPIKNMSEGNTAPQMNDPNGVRQISMTINNNLRNLSAPVTNLSASVTNLSAPVANFQNCHQINIPQQCNGTVTPNNMASFVAVPQNVMLTTLRIPQNGLPAQTLGQQNNMSAFNRPNVNVTSPTKLNGQFVFPLVQNINGTVVQIPNLMAKIPNFVLPQTPQLTTPRQDHLQNQQPAQILINGTLLKLANTMATPYQNVNKPPVTSQPISVINKNIPGMQAVGMTVQSKPNYTVNLSHPVYMPQSGYIVTSVPNINVKETWSYTHTNVASSSQTTCSNPIVQQPPPMVANFTTQTLHTSSIPLAPVKSPDNPIQGTDPPSSTVKEPEISEVLNPKCDIPWLSKTINNNIVSFETNNMTSRPFAEVSSLTEKLENYSERMCDKKITKNEKIDDKRIESTSELKKVEDIARREETIFTQITVLKDVSSNVHNTVIEANFCSATTESESGIGTDKSIDSPSDSQTSKECDEDSSLSLSVSVCSVEVPSQKSPLLKQPKILRFPPNIVTKSNSSQRTSSSDATVTVCLWENCKKEFDGDPDLLDHLQSAHVVPQAGKENYVCLWEQCKVRGKPSCSRLWLERHALSHGGNKPFKCIVDGCERRFSTQILLERHVNNHFNEATPSSAANKKSSDSSSKLIRRNGKKLRYRRQPWSARMFDFFDSSTMECLAWRLARCTRWRLGGACPLREPAGRHTLTLHAALAAVRYNAAERRREALVTYYPPNVLDDEWLPEKEVKRIKRVEIAQLASHTKVIVYEQFCASYTRSIVSAPSPAPPAPSGPSPSRVMPARHCTSSRLLNKLIAKQKRGERTCSATNVPPVYRDEERDRERPDVAGARKRKLGRRHGGNSFWPCGR